MLKKNQKKMVKLWNEKCCVEICAPAQLSTFSTSMPSLEGLNNLYLINMNTKYLNLF